MAESVVLGEPGDRVTDPVGAVAVRVGLGDGEKDTVSLRVTLREPERVVRVGDWLVEPEGLPRVMDRLNDWVREAVGVVEKVKVPVPMRLTDPLLEGLRVPVCDVLGVAEAVRDGLPLRDSGMLSEGVSEVENVDVAVWVTAYVADSDSECVGVPLCEKVPVSEVGVLVGESVRVSVWEYDAVTDPVVLRVGGDRLTV